MRYKMPVAVHLFLIKEDKILLLRRYNTGYEDGNYSVIAGHIDGNETYIDAMIREAKEEAGINIKSEYLTPVQVMHRKTYAEERIDYFFTCERWDGDIINMEPNKCDQLKWFKLSDLPNNVVPYVRYAISMFIKDKKFTDFGWN